jgi:hypothetical protein
MQYHKNYYRKVQEVFSNTIYIHQHEQNIGKLYGGRAGIVSALTDEHKSIAAKNQYKNLFLKNSNLSPKALEMIQIASGHTEEEVWKAISNGFVNSLKQNLNLSSLQALHGVAANMKSIPQIMQGKEGKLKKQQEFFKQLGQAVSVMEGHNSGLGLALSQLGSGRQRAMSWKGMGSALANAVAKFKKSNNYTMLKGTDLESMNAVINSLNNLASNFKTQATKSGKAMLSEESWRSTFNNVFTGLSEGLGARMTASAFGAANSVVKMVGTKTSAPVIFTPTQEYSYGKPIVGKTDIKATNMQLSVDEKSVLGQYGNITIDLGVSMKFYRAQSFSISGGKTLTISSGSGGSLASALNAVYGGNSARSLYYAYNVLAHEQEPGQSLVHDALLSRNILRLFSSTGTAGDFSQFMLINGEIVSIWDIVQYASNTFLGTSSSRNKNQAISISIEGRKDIIAAAKNASNSGESILKQAMNRSRSVNAAINSATIKATLHVHKLALLYGNK